MLRMNLLLVCVVAVASPSASAVAQKSDAAAVVKKGVEFLGGTKNLKTYKAATYEDKGTYYGMGDGLPYTGKYAVVYPDKYRMEIAGVFTTVLNGDKGWVSSQGNVMEMTKEQLAATKEAQYESVIAQLYPLLEGSQYKLSLDGKASVGKTPAVIVKVQSKGHRDVRLFFDPKTGELVKTESMVPPEDMPDKKVKQESFYSDYKTVQGIKYPSKMRITRDGKKYIETTVTDYKPLKSLPEKTFAKPK